MTTEKRAQTLQGADLLHRQECDPLHKKTVNVGSITTPQQYGEQARRRESKQAEVQTPTRVLTGARSRRVHRLIRIRQQACCGGSRCLQVFVERPVPLSSRHYPESGCSTSSIWARPSQVAP